MQIATLQDDVRGTEVKRYAASSATAHDYSAVHVGTQLSIVGCLATGRDDEDRSCTLCGATGVRHTKQLIAGHVSLKWT